MDSDWEAVGKSISQRLDELGMTQLELASTSGVAPATIREIQYTKLVRRRSPRTLAALSEALKWPPSYLDQVLRGDVAKPHADEANDPVLAELNAIHQQLQSLRERVGSLERRLGDEGAES